MKKNPRFPLFSASAAPSSGYRRAAYWIKLAAGTALLLLLTLSLCNAVQSVTLAWDRNAEPDIATHKLYYGTQRGNPSQSFGSYSCNVIGNVLGCGWGANSWSGPGTFNYEMSGQPAYSDQSVIYRPGYPNVGNNGTDAGDVAVTWPLISNSPYPDSNVASTLYRHGNYDTKNAATVWDAENADHSIPLHSSKPSYFGNLSWPAFNPSNPTAASVDDIPAGYQYVNGQDPPAGAGDSIGTLNVRNRMIVSP